MITIGQLAAYAGVTVRAVRHYHQRGLLDEPDRDASGYRRYTAQHVIDLIKIKTLAAAGVPLARVKELRVAGPTEFTRAVDEIDRNLEERIADLTRARQRIRALSGGDRLFVPEQVAAYLDFLRAIGLSARYVQIERDLWILLWAVDPHDVDRRIRERREGLADPELQRLILDFDQAFTADPDDPSLHDIARRMIDVTISRSGWDDKAWNDGTDFQALLQNAIMGRSPAWDEIQHLAIDRFYRLRSEQLSPDARHLTEAVDPESASA
jgi:DNA-binding transcriptional MerR regulator